MNLPPDDKPMATHSAAPRTVQLAILLLCLFALAKVSGQTNAECDRIIAELCGRKGELTGYSITAVETNILFLANSPAVRALRARPELTSKLAAMAGKGVVGRTNTVSYTYTFQDGIESIESLAKDAAGRHLYQNKQAATRELIFSSQTYLDVPEAVARASNSTSGQIWRNTRGMPSLDKECSVSTPPVWLWRGQLGEWLRQTDVTKCHRDTGPDGEEIIELTLTTGPDGPPYLAGPRLPCRVRLRSRDLTPLKFEILEANGVVESSIDTEFTAFGPGVLVCKKAVSRAYEDHQLCQENVWQLTGVKTEKPREAPTVSSFFTVGTHIGDKRFSRPLAYRLGFRPPTDAELQGMLTNKAGVPLYEAATLTPPEPSGSRISRLAFFLGATCILLAAPGLVIASRKAATWRRR